MDEVERLVRAEQNVLQQLAMLRDALSMVTAWEDQQLPGWHRFATARVLLQLEEERIIAASYRWADDHPDGEEGEEQEEEERVAEYPEEWRDAMADVELLGYVNNDWDAGQEEWENEDEEEEQWNIEEEQWNIDVDMWDDDEDEGYEEGESEEEEEGEEEV